MLLPVLFFFNDLEFWFRFFFFVCFFLFVFVFIVGLSLFYWFFLFRKIKFSCNHCMYTIGFIRPLASDMYSHYCLEFHHFISSKFMGLTRNY